jgi:outer membrane protein assembly factor BamB
MCQVEIKPDQIGPRWKAGAIGKASNAYYGYDNFNTLTASNGIFYAAGNNILKARKEADGSLVWSYDVSGLPYPSVNPPAVDNGIVYMAAGQQSSTYLFGFDAASGAVRFKSPMSSQWENYLAPVAVGDAVYTEAGTYGGLYAFMPTGEQMFFGHTAQIFDVEPSRGRQARSICTTEPCMYSTVRRARC